MNPVEETDRFGSYLYEVLRGVDDAEFVDLEYIGFGILRVKLQSGTAMLVIATPVDDDGAEGIP